MSSGIPNIDLLTVIAIAANVTGGLMAVPQATKLVASRRVHGVSPVWAAASMTVNAWWVAYGFAIGDLGIVPVSVVSVMAYLAIGIALVRFGGHHRTALTMLAIVVLIGAVPFVAVRVGGWPTAGVVLGSLYGVQLLPAVVGVYRATDVSGVSLATWSIAFTEAVLWSVYGIARTDIGLIVLGASGTAMSGLVLARLLLRRTRQDYDVIGLAPA